MHALPSRWKHSECHFKITPLFPLRKQSLITKIISQSKEGWGDPQGQCDFSGQVVMTADGSDDRWCGFCCPKLNTALNTALYPRTVPSAFLQEFSPPFPSASLLLLLSTCLSLFPFFFVNISFIRERVSDRARAGAEGEADSLLLSKEPDVQLNPNTPGS